MKALAIAGVLAVLLAASIDAKGPTTRIEIRDLAAGSVSQLTDRTVVDQFQVWAGPGTYSGPSGQATEGTEGFIIDWRSGPITERPAQLRRYELRFYVAPRGSVPAAIANKPPADKLAYVALYEHDPATGRGYVYLPGGSDEHFRLNVASIHRQGLNGKWFRASQAWQSAFMSLPAVR
jgi:hypothetical protein